MQCVSAVFYVSYCGTGVSSSTEFLPSITLSCSVLKQRNQRPGSFHKYMIVSVFQMWTCGKCSYAYNPIQSQTCDICNLPRSPKEDSSSNSKSATKKQRSQSNEKADSNLSEDFQLVTRDILTKVASNGSHDSLWICSRCTLENSGQEADGSQTCLACGASRMPDHWECAKCTLHNERSADKCKVCDSPRLHEVSLDASTKLLKCPACTFENKLTQTICEMCGTVLNNVAAENSRRLAR